MDLEVFLNKSQLLELANKKISKSDYFFPKWLVIKDLLTIYLVPQTNQFILKIKWHIQGFPIIRGISIIKLSLDEGEPLKVFRKRNHFTIKGWESILNGMMTRQLKLLRSIDVWANLHHLKFSLVEIGLHQSSLRLVLIVSGQASLEIKPETVPVYYQNKAKLILSNLNEAVLAPFVIQLTIFNSTLSVWSKEIPVEKSNYNGFGLGKVLLKLNEGKLHIITQIEYPFNGYMKTSCGIILDKNSGKLLLSDVKSRLESNNILAHIAHLSFKNSLHQIISNRLEEVINLKIKQKAINQIEKMVQLDNFVADYDSLKIEDNVLNVTIKLHGKMSIQEPSLFYKS